MGRLFRQSYKYEMHNCWESPHSKFCLFNMRSTTKPLAIVEYLQLSQLQGRLSVFFFLFSFLFPTHSFLQSLLFFFYLIFLFSRFISFIISRFYLFKSAVSLAEIPPIPCTQSHHVSFLLFSHLIVFKESARLYRSEIESLITWTEDLN